jgi:flavin reductase (DIM6/NTAB) family NADH-FMN oxidoreductase RutF
MKLELSVTPPAGLKEAWPGQFEIGRWLDNVIPFPGQLFIVTTRKPNGLHNAQLNAWGMTGGPGSSPCFLFLDNDHSDTHRLVKANGEFGINFCPHNIKEKAFNTIKHYTEDEDEVIQSGLTPLDGLKTNVCRIEECVAHYECKLDWIKDLSNGHVLTCGKIVAASVDDGLVTGDMQEKFATAGIMYYVKPSVDYNNGWEVAETNPYEGVCPKWIV